MGSNIVNRSLPGVGASQEIPIHGGRRIAVVTRHDGMRDLVIYGEDGGPAECVVEVTESEANAVAGLLGHPELTARLRDMQRFADAVVTEQLPMPDHSPYAGSPISETHAHTRTGASIVAVIRSTMPHAAPGPEFVLQAGDLVVAVGTREGIDKLTHILDGTG